MDLIRNSRDQNSLTVAQLKQHLSAVDDDLLVIFEHVIGDEVPDQSHSIDAFQVRGGFFILCSLDD